MFEALAQQCASSVLAACITRLVSPTDPAHASAAGNAGSSTATPNASYTIPASNSSPIAEPHAAGTGYRTSSPRVMPAIAQTQIHRSSNSREKPRKLGAPSIAPRIN